MVCRCGAAVGMFADIKRWVILYLYAGSGSFGYMPYLDPQGELDLSNRYVFGNCSEMKTKLIKGKSVGDIGK